MCYYNSVRISDQEFIRLQDFEKIISHPEFFDQPLINGFDYGMHPVLKKSEDGKDFELTEMEWGFLPPYLFSRDKIHDFRFGSKRPDGKWQAGFTTLNAKGEELLHENKMFRDAALHRRCLVLSSGFYEWRHLPRVSQKTGKPLKTAEKYPYYIQLDGHDYFYMAGVWQPWTDRNTGEYTETFAIVTTSANPLMAQIHNSKQRMPVILTEELASEWLMGSLSEERILEIAQFRIDGEKLRAFTISRNFRESPVPHEPATYASLPPLQTGDRAGMSLFS